VVRFDRRTEFGVGSDTSIRERVLKIEMSEVINHPISDVFKFYVDDHLENHPRWDPEMQLSLATDGEVGIGTVFNRRHTHFGDPVEGSMTVIEFERNQAFGLAIDDGFGEFYGRLRFEAMGESATQVSTLVDVPGMPETADSSRLRSIAERWLHNTENLISGTPTP
jgi:hypothetical protein